MKISIYNRQRALNFSKSALKKAVQTVLSFLELHPEEIAIYFVTSKKIAELHQEFFNDPSPTDCMTFPLDATFLGEVFVCPEVALDYAKKQGMDVHEETLLYVIHGILHLAGYEDHTPQKKRVMRKMEKKCMDKLKEDGLFLR